MKEDNKYLNLSHARTDEQKKLMEKIKKDGVCPFCIEYIKKYHPKPILQEGDWWIVTENMSPYEGSKFHVIFIYKKHIENFNEINSEASYELMSLVSEISKKNNITGGALMIRFGASNNTGASVSHLHAHLIVGEASKNDKNIESLKVKVGYKYKKS